MHPDSDSKIVVLTDEEEIEPSEEFDRLGNIISSIVVDSPPKVTIGIYGEWGTGKSTLMRLVENKLKTKDNEGNQNIFQVWFNAWKFEREDRFAAIALLKTIAYQMTEQPKFYSLSKTIRKTLKILGMDLLQKIATQTLINEKGVEFAQENLTQNLDFLEKIDGLDKDTIYFEGIEQIRAEIADIRKTDPDFRIVVYVDDLDRCSPKMALEVLESIKVFLDIEGFIYILGLSHNTIFKLVNQSYKDTGIDGVEYIKKIIQIPIKLPQWTKEDAQKILDEKLVPRLSPKYEKIFSDKKTQVLISELEQNPRRIKRIVNNLIIAHETFSAKEAGKYLDIEELFLFQILKKRCPVIYEKYREPSEVFENLVIDCDDIVRSDAFLEYKNVLVTNSDELIQEAKKNFEMSLLRESFRSNKKHILGLDSNGIQFLDKYGYKLNKIKHWSIYRAATDILEEVDIKGIPKFTLNESESSKIMQDP